MDGTRLATASEKGTIIRLYDTFAGTCLRELRRGAKEAAIHCIGFSASSDFLCCSSDSGTVHVFSLQGGAEAGSGGARGGAAAVEPPKSGGLSFMKSLLPGYFSSEWSVAQFRVPDSLSLCAFGSEPNSIIVLTAEGVVYTCTFDPVHGGECTQENLTRFLGDGDGIDQTKFAGKTPEHEDDHDHDDHDHDET
mmetsp:Transcript_42772/g.92925  ORF Transcript_42772/g.92925 Transcript_42772/m.92925 type:complete len:193 (-) Transcript_42772:56-634(-)